MHKLFAQQSSVTEHAATLMRGMREVIQRLIREYLANDDPRFDWVRPSVEKLNFLPLYLGWVAALGVRPDGSFVRWDHEDDRETVKPLNDAYLERMAICGGALKYPELAALIPQRPALAIECSLCKGGGRIEGVPENVICQCGGLGWMIPGESSTGGPV